jgi:hypothetical protein
MTSAARLAPPPGRAACPSRTHPGDICLKVKAGSGFHLCRNIPGESTQCEGAAPPLAGRA